MRSADWPKLPVPSFRTDDWPMPTNAQHEEWKKNETKELETADRKRRMAMAAFAQLEDYLARHSGRRFGEEILALKKERIRATISEYLGSDAGQRLGQENREEVKKLEQIQQLLN